MPKKDQNWVVDQVMAIEAPEAVADAAAQPAGRAVDRAARAAPRRR